MPVSSLSFQRPPDLWRADELAAGPPRTVPTGHAALDAELPGGGWPLGGLIELLQPAPDTPTWPLLLPAVACGGAVALVNPPHEPFLPALAAAGVRAGGVLWLAADAPAAQLWLAEQALRCADVAAVLAWLPRVRAADLRRLHLAAAQRGDPLLFALRPASGGGGLARAAAPAGRCGGGRARPARAPAQAARPAAGRAPAPARAARPPARAAGRQRARPAAGRRGAALRGARRFGFSRRRRCTGSPCSGRLKTAQQRSMRAPSGRRRAAPRRPGPPRGAADHAKRGSVGV
ncbi:translesion DNA synthesis-associated protein ImuA [Ottowia sp.]|uniref:translesion DNA synthesis-associated protein ImuA n=1 Tax=Ottowia sp. TaxID=1898956 RepID=UPI0025F546F5|nr:translesion DNA synthesis-associated protein ImuA [Ottowia sp.]